MAESKIEIWKTILKNNRMEKYKEYINIARKNGYKCLNMYNFYMLQILHISSIGIIVKIRLELKQ